MTAEKIAVEVRLSLGRAGERATNWEEFSATATLRVIHLGHEIESFVLMQSYLPKESGLSSGCGLYALGLIRAYHGLTLLEPSFDIMHNLACVMCAQLKVNCIAEGMPFTSPSAES
ncbi:hypothetical protein pipiens_004900 [Culex pipiens pipiens]|uniref:GHMP kinase N-terminal domain-containing protein n=1 Tax=Culex pipiens pipiens TaxID=38569 RepID=A0ABD1CDS8_CULPP